MSDEKYARGMAIRRSVLGDAHANGRPVRAEITDRHGNLLAANQDTDNIYSFQVDQETGLLAPAGHHVHVPAPVCIKWL